MSFEQRVQRVLNGALSSINAFSAGYNQPVETTAKDIDRAKKALYAVKSPHMTDEQFEALSFEFLHRLHNYPNMED
mgnify:CR=1 FL=1|jgi:hypothetical protein|tara:strand:- start:22 stop:249 length:228 start_codon:yes stop_codon:yes gene_type:complete